MRRRVSRGRRHMAYPSTTSFEMSKVEEIERAIQQLSSDDLSEFRAWFATFDAEVWDREFDEDVQAGRLDALAQEALDDWHGGRCTDLSTIERRPASGLAIVGSPRPSGAKLMLASHS